MPSDPELPSSSRLENLSFSPAGVQLDLEGRTLWIKKENDGPSVAALQSLYAAALADFRRPRAAPEKPGWLARLGSWLGRLLRGPGGEPPPRPAEPAARQPEAAGATRSARPSAVREPDPAPVPAGENAPGAPRPRTLPRSAEAPLPPVLEAGEPLLRAVFADRGGVHVIWRQVRPGLQPEDTEIVRPMDSKVAASLQDCYGHLARLGYRVVGLDLRPAGPAERDGDRAEAAPEKQAASPRPGKTPVTGPAPEKAAARTVVMRLHPEPADQPDRALVSPVDNAENTQVLVAPERLLRSLRAAADPARPAEDRLTYLRCASGKNGLKVVEVGLGEGKENAPARWAGIARWSAEQAEAAAAGKPSPGRSPGPELDLAPGA